MEKRNKAIAIAKPFFAGESKHEELFVTSDGQVFTVDHYADSHAQTLADKSIEIVTKDNALKATIVVPEVEDRPVIIPEAGKIVDAKLMPTSNTEAHTLVDVVNVDEDAQKAQAEAQAKAQAAADNQAEIDDKDQAKIEDVAKAKAEEAGKADQKAQAQADEDAKAEEVAKAKAEEAAKKAEADKTKAKSKAKKK